MTHYPPLDIDELDKFVTVIDRATHEPDYLDPGICPYDEGTTERLRRLLDWVHPVARATVPEADPKNPVGRPSKQVIIPTDELEKEVNEIRQEIAAMKIDAKDMETSDRIQIVKTRTVLVEKILSMKERVNGIKKQQQFVATVMGLMEDVMDQKQREEMIKKLEPYIDE